MNISGKITAGFMVAVVLLTMAGCAGKDGKEVPAEDLAREGLELFDRGKYYKALQTFDIIKDRFPFSRFSLLAELKSADCKFYMEEYEEAQGLYEEFEKNHPTNEAIPYVIFQTGRCQYTKIDTVDRDTSGAHKAIEIFTRLIKTYPKSSYVVEAKALIKKSTEFLGEHELYVANWYLKTEQPEQARIRIEYLLDHYPETFAAAEANRMLALLEKEPGKEPVKK
ncbi:MAG: outer membrane protein assembly factor BamD [Proteobacteria bacterium]|nr:outer membrane protein assembly factor BamD [Pseudomonadota bacterium]MBU1737157.1 outer membrane protein assembly factor BamD [Pseudomonadota bacterium]